MILLTGGNGVLGRELKKLIELDSPDKRHFNILREPVVNCYKEKLREEYDLIVHAAAFTDLVRAETERKLAYETNVIGTRNLARLGIPMIYISTEYVFDGEKGNYNEQDSPNPKNYYAYTKYLGELQSRNTKSVVIRCLFKARPFKHDAACVDQFTSGDYVDRIAPEIAMAIKKFDKLPDTIHIGTGRKRTIDLARESRTVKEITTEEIRTVKLPKDTSLDTRLWEGIKNER